MFKQVAENPAPVLRKGPYLPPLDRPWIGSLTRVPAEHPLPLKAELAAAKSIYGEARGTVTKIFARLRRGGGLDMPLAESAVDSLVASIWRNPEALSWLARMKSKDDYLYNHSLAASVWALAFSRHLGLDRDTARSLGMGAMLLDIGKTQLPTELLQKKGKPEPHEWAILQRHVDMGLAIVDKVPSADACVRSMIATHHERLDGSGYPKQLAGDDIPLAGRIAGIVDCYDAMTSDRFYAKGKSAHETARELKKLGKTWFPAELVELFIQAVGTFPTGSLVELNSGEVGVVTAQNGAQRLQPEVMLILDARKAMREQFSLIDLQQPEHGDAGNPALWIAQGLEAGAHGIDPTEFFLSMGEAPHA